MKFSDKIKFSESITKEDFTKFMKVIKEHDPKTYAEEMQDGGKDLYDYWSNLGSKRFNAKHQANLERWGIKED